VKHVFGPVWSRRLGQSLGIDPIPFKTCNWNCVYCQLGRTSPLTKKRHDYFPSRDIVEEVQSVLENHGPKTIDWITFVGSGEPTLHAHLGWMIRHLKSSSRSAQIPIAVITNGSLLYVPEVRDELLEADAVMPSLDAGTERLYRKINRPLAELSFERLVAGLIAFRKKFSGNLWIEVMLIKGLNDTADALKDLAAVIHRTGADEVHLNVPERPPCEPWVQGADAPDLQRAIEILGNTVRAVHSGEGEFDLSGFDSVVDAVIGIIMRHPMREQEIVKSLKRWPGREVSDALERLNRNEQAQIVMRGGQRFWSYAGARYVKE
jgi:wyosine [tRNA(Phe)-imidazoG37] synthetase (radical SAM superfamily)